MPCPRIIYLLRVQPRGIRPLISGKAHLVEAQLDIAELDYLIPDRWRLINPYGAGPDPSDLVRVLVHGNVELIRKREENAGRVVLGNQATVNKQCLPFDVAGDLGGQHDALARNQRRHTHIPMDEMRRRRSRVNGHFRPSTSPIRRDEDPLQSRRVELGDVGIPPSHQPQAARDVDGMRLDSFGHGQVGPGGAIRCDRNAADRPLSEVPEVRQDAAVTHGLEPGDFTYARIEPSPLEQRIRGQLLGSRVLRDDRGALYSDRIRLFRRGVGRSCRRMLRLH